MSNNSNDAKALSLLQEISRRKAEIARLEKPTWKTSMSFTYQPHPHPGPYINLHVESSISILLSILGFLQTKEAEYYKAQKTISLSPQDTPSFTWQGHSFTSWQDDISLKIDRLLISKKKETLATLEARVNSLLSPDLRAQMELDLISKELS